MQSDAAAILPVRLIGPAAMTAAGRQEPFGLPAAREQVPAPSPLARLAVDPGVEPAVELAVAPARPTAQRVRNPQRATM